MKMRRFLIPALLLGAVAFSACGQDSDNDSSGSGESLNGEWIAVSGNTDGVDVVLIDGYDVTLSVDGDEVRGRAACNSYQGTVDLGDGTITVAELMWTEMGCEPAVHETEQAFLGALGDAATYTVSEDTLTLTGTDDEWVFTRVESVETS